MNITIFVWKHRTFHKGPHFHIRSWYRSSLCWDFRKWCFVQKINIYSSCILKLYCSKWAYSSSWLFSSPFCSLNHEKSVQQPYATSSSLPPHFNSWQFINSKKGKKFREMWIEVENEWLTVGEQWTDSNLLSRLCLSNSPHCAYLL